MAPLNSTRQTYNQGCYHIHPCSPKSCNSHVRLCKADLPFSLHCRRSCMFRRHNRFARESAQHEDDDDDEEEDLPLLDPNHTLALYNNFACAYHSSGNDAKADETWENVLSQLWCILDVGFNSDEVECIPDALANAAHLLDPHLGCTAIAA